MTITIVTFVLRQAVYCIIPLMIVALAAMFSERCGVRNIGMEGTMMFGAFSGVLLIYFYSGVIESQILLVLAILVGGIAGMLISLLHAYACINLSAHQIISGIAINMLIPAFTELLDYVIVGGMQLPFKNTFRIDNLWGWGDIPIIGSIFFKNTYITTFIGIFILLACWFTMKYTRFGMRLSACGENPYAAASVGVSVKKYRYAGILLSGLLAGIGGVAFIIPSTVEYTCSVAGYGFLAIGVLVFGSWKPSKICIAAVFFGLMKTIGSVYTGVPLLRDSGINSYLFKAIPYAATIIALVIFSSKSKEPAALGEIYGQNQR